MAASGRWFFPGHLNQPWIGWKQTISNQPAGSHPVQQGAAKGFPGECVNSLGHSLNSTEKDSIIVL